MKSGSVAVIGRANAGKSTLVNVLVGEKVSIVSPKPQTTRERILGVLTADGYQIVFEDTPGLYRAKGRLNDYMQRSAGAAAKEVDLILFVIDGHAGIKQADLDALARFKGEVPVIVALTKTDIMPKEKIPEELLMFSGLDVLGPVPVSARKGSNIKRLLALILENLPEGEPIFEDDVISDKSENFMLREILREKLLLLLDKEIPHGVAVETAEYFIDEYGTAHVSLDIICEKPNHKAIIIGKQGAKLKEISSFARASMEKFLDKKVFLTVYVKVRENWRNDPQMLSDLGYTEAKR